MFHGGIWLSSLLSEAVNEEVAQVSSKQAQGQAFSCLRPSWLQPAHPRLLAASSLWSGLCRLHSLPCALLSPALSTQPPCPPSPCPPVPVLQVSSQVSPPWEAFPDLSSVPASPSIACSHSLLSGSRSRGREWLLHRQAGGQTGWIGSPWGGLVPLAFSWPRPCGTPQRETLGEDSGCWFGCWWGSL